MRCSAERELIRLRRATVPTAALAPGRARLEETMRLFPMIVVAQSRMFAWRPVALALVVVFVTVGSGTVWASQGSLPGDRLYSVKMVSEEIGGALVFGDNAKMRSYAQLAERRLTEAGRVVADDRAAHTESDERVQTLLRSYEHQVFRLNEMAIKIGSQEHVSPKAAVAVAEAADRVMRRHEALVTEEATSSPLLIEAAYVPLELEANVRIPSEIVMLQNDLPDEAQERPEEGKRRSRRRQQELLDNERLHLDLRDRAERLRAFMERARDFEASGVR